jgi:hypothetical protein
MDVHGGSTATNRASRRRVRSVTAAAAVALLMTVALVRLGAGADVAHAQDYDQYGGCFGEVTEIAGAGLTIWAGERGNLQARLPGRAGNTFYDPWLEHGDAGFFVGVTDSPNAEVDGKVFGPPMSGSLPTDRYWQAESFDPASGTGGQEDPFRQVTSYRGTVAGTPVLRVVQTIEHVSGQSAFRVGYAVENLSGQPLAFRASTAADLYAEDDDSGMGALVLGPPRFVGGVNPDVGLAAGIEEDPDTPFDHYQVDAYYEIFDAIDDIDGPGFDDTVIDRYTDNGVGVQWDAYAQTPLQPGQTATFSLLWRFAAPAPLWLTPGWASLEQGATHTVRARALDSVGDPYDGRVLRWAISGANPGAGTATTGPDGEAEISWSGTQAGRDELTVYLDLDDDGSRDATEPQAVVKARFIALAGVTTTPPPPPPPPPPTTTTSPPTATTPVPPPAAPPTAHTGPDTAPPAGRLWGPLRASVRAIIRSGLKTTLSTSEPVTVRQLLYRVRRGAARPRVHRKLLGRAIAHVRDAGIATVTLKLTRRGRRTVRTARTVRAVLRTSLTDAAGNTTRLPRNQVPIRRWQRRAT